MRKTFKSQYWKVKTHKRYIHLNSKHARDLKFGMYFPSVALHKFDAVILKTLFLTNLWPKNCLKSNMVASFWQFFGNKWQKRKIFKIATSNLWNDRRGRYIPNFKSLVCLLFKWMYLLTFCQFSLLRFKGFACTLFTALQANPDFQKSITKARNKKILHGFLHLLHLNKIFINNFK